MKTENIFLNIRIQISLCCSSGWTKGLHNSFCSVCWKEKYYPCSLDFPLIRAHWQIWFLWSFQEGWSRSMTSNFGTSKKRPWCNSRSDTQQSVWVASHPQLFNHATVVQYTYPCRLAPFSEVRVGGGKEWRNEKVGKIQYYRCVTTRCPLGVFPIYANFNCIYALHLLADWSQ